jgi:hypothetical protein
MIEVQSVPAVQKKSSKFAASLRLSLVRTYRFIQRIERCLKVDALESCLLNIGDEYGFDALFGGLVPNSRVSSEEIEARILTPVRRKPLGLLH